MAHLGFVCLVLSRSAGTVTMCARLPSPRTSVCKVHTWEIGPSALCPEVPDPGCECVGELHPSASTFDTCV